MYLEKYWISKWQVGGVLDTDIEKWVVKGEETKKAFMALYFFFFSHDQTK